MSHVVFSSTALRGTNKVGKITPDADGYYTLVLGGLNTFNSGGAYYQLAGAEHLFKESSIFMRRVKDGNLYAELTHPEKTSLMTARDWLMRVLKIDYKNVCAHIKEVRLDNESVKGEDGQPVLAIIGKVKPHGPHAKLMQDALENNCQNVCFSIRSLTEDVQQGNVLVKTLQTIVTFDLVIEPGIATAKKWFSPALESLIEPFVITKEYLSGLVYPNNDGVAMESTVSVEGILDELGWKQSPKTQIRTLDWK